MSELSSLIEKITLLATEKPCFLVALDGRCAAGKTTLAGELSAALDGFSIHMDDFFLPFELRTPERMEEVAGNMDLARFLNEVLLPLSNGETVIYKPYSCHVRSFTDSFTLPRKRIYIIEGSYSLHPILREFYDLSVFVSTDSATQLKRIEARKPEALSAFVSRWIPYEERYFAACGVEEHCDIIYRT